MFYITIDEPINRDKVSDIDSYFDMEFEDNWFDNQFAKDVIKGIDNSIHVEGSFIRSPILGAISPRDLSTGCKGVLLLQNVDNILVNGDRFGDNCFPWLSKLGEIKDINITIHHYPMNWDFEVHAVVTNYNKKVDTMAELCKCILEGLTGCKV